ncbi:MAG: TSUP family transporter [Verrucomicrobium sp.]|nr:TSUP family transporter [Verrucomicrobium sp.]
MSDPALVYGVLGLGAFAAGFVDAVVGGGGLIQLPAFLNALPAAPPATVFGTNKLAAVFGTASAAVRYARRIAPPWRIVLPAMIAAGLAAYGGAHLATLVPREYMRPLILALLVAVTLHTYFRKDFGAVDRDHPLSRRSVALALAIGGALGFYDGFFGPGTGSFLIFLFIRCFGFDFLRASLCAKWVNTATNVTAILSFALSGHILYRLGLLAAACNVAGSLAGSHLALRHGSGFVRRAFLLVSLALIAKFGWDTFR